MLGLEAHRTTKRGERMIVQREDPEQFKDEFGIRCRRLNLEELQIKAPFGSMWCLIGPGVSSNPDTHDEAEMVAIVEGMGSVRLDGESVEVAAGDVVHLPPNSEHVLTNTSDTRPLRVLSMYW